MKRVLFLNILDLVCAHDLFFIDERDVPSKRGSSFIQKCTSTMRLLANDIKANATNEYYKLRVNTSMESMQ
jgi:hypothetical protein